MRRTGLALLLALVAVALTVASCGGDDDDDGDGGQASSGNGPSCDGGKITVGSVSTLSGPVTFADVPNAAEAVFDQLNAKGGLNGCDVEYVKADDKGDPQVASQVARDLVQNKGAAVLAGSGSLLDCEVNGNFYAQQDIGSVQGLGVDAACWSTPNISPVNVGPFVLTTAMLYYASETLKAKNPCVFNIIIAGTKDAYTQAVDNWTKLTGKKLKLHDTSLPPEGDYTPYVLRARDAGCDAVLTNTVEPQAVAWMNAVQRQKIKGIDWLFLAPAYTEGVAKALAGLDQPIYAGTEWEPFTESDSPANADWKATMEKAGQPLTAFSQGGYESAHALIEVLKGVDGEVNRESAIEALRDMKPYETDLVGTPYLFGPGDTHASNRATKVMRLEKGKWVVETPDWVVLPDAEEE